MTEQAVVFSSRSGPLVGILHTPEQRPWVAPPVIIIVGGPQTRVGSHRQFLLLARFLCLAGVPVLRFDYSGVGDSPGSKSDFLQAVADLGAAVDFLAERLETSSVCLWGLCDAASLALMYLDSTRDKRVKHLVALNPWVRQTNTEAQVKLKYYYVNRLLSKAFWLKLVRLDIDYISSVKDFVLNIRKAFGSSAGNDSPKSDSGADSRTFKVYSESNYVEAMKSGLESFTGGFHLVMSGNDLTADEFRLLCRSDKRWAQLVPLKVSTRLDIENANHTFSSAQWRNEVEQFTLSCISA